MSPPRPSLEALFGVSYFPFPSSTMTLHPHRHLERDRGIQAHAEAAWDCGHSDLVRVYIANNKDFRDKLKRLLRRCYRKGEQPNIDGVDISYHAESEDPLHKVRVRLSTIDSDSDEDFSSLTHFQETMAAIERRIDLRIAELRALADRPKQPSS